MSAATLPDLSPTLPLALTDLSHEYPSASGPVTVLNDVSATFPARSWTAIMGPSGSGKSTLLLCAAGLLRASQGTVELAGLRIGDASDSQLTKLRRGRVGFVFQAFNLVPSLTAAQNVELPLRLAGDRPKKQVAIGALEQVGLDVQHAKRRPAELSGGQQQRVAIARALAANPAVLFADEPTGALDSRTGEEVLAAFAMMVAAGTTVVMVTHDPGVAARADRTLFLFDGRLVDETTGASSTQIATRIAELDAVRSSS